MSDTIAESLRAIGFRTSGDSIQALLVHATKNRLSVTQAFEQLVAMERRERDNRNLATRLKAATLGNVTPLDQFDWQHPRRVDRGLYEQLLTLDFMTKRQNVLLRGPSGVGKTTLVQNLGLAALKHGYTVRFDTLAGALADLLKQESLPATERRLRFYTRPSLLILDEIGYLPCDSRAADMLFNIVSRRHEQRSTAITTNISFKLWGKLFGGAACVAALVDRFAQHCHVLDIDADSWRQKTAVARSPEKSHPDSQQRPQRPKETK